MNREERLNYASYMHAMLGLGFYLDEAEDLRALAQQINGHNTTLCEAHPQQTLDRATKQRERLRHKVAQIVATCVGRSERAHLRIEIVHQGDPRGRAFYLRYVDERGIERELSPH